MPLFSLFAMLGTSPSLVVLVLNDFSGFSFVARDLSWPCSSSNQVIVKFWFSSAMIWCRRREVYQWPHKYNPGDDGLSNMEYWLPRGYNLPKCEGAEILKSSKTLLLQISTSRFRAALKNKDMPWKKILEDDPSLQGYLQVWVLLPKHLRNYFFIRRLFSKSSWILLSSVLTRPWCKRLKWWVKVLFLFAPKILSRNKQNNLYPTWSSLRW